MRCSKCGTESTSGKKFCPECGSPLSHRCAKCGADNSPSAKFCEDCGAALETPAVASSEKSNEAPIRVIDAPASENLDGERKTVTALFADIKGSTELEQDLDPEDARAIVDPALKLMITAVRRYDGYIVQSTGDGSSLYSARRSRTKTIRSARSTPRCGCMRRSGAAPIAALEMSAVQQARLEQLRSMTALARVLRAQNRGEEARAMLAEIYGWFTEGFDTADLKDAKALLDSLD